MGELNFRPVFGTFIHQTPLLMVHLVMWHLLFSSLGWVFSCHQIWNDYWTIMIEICDLCSVNDKICKYSYDISLELNFLSKSLKNFVKLSVQGKFNKFEAHLKPHFKWHLNKKCICCLLKTSDCYTHIGMTRQLNIEFVNKKHHNKG